jgi:pyruvate/2-oxoglutarate dehydrogenase complex dihydrolipoamide acyltransferase (E2) component
MFSKKFVRLKNPSSWRRLAVANWSAPDDPTVYGSLNIDFTNGQDYLKKINENSKIKISETHLVAKAIALTLKRFPDLNGIVRRRKIYLRKTVDIFLQVAVAEQDENEKPDLSGVVIESCDEKSLSEIATELKEKSQNVRSKEDERFKSTLNLLKFVPSLLLPWVLKLISFLIYDLGLDLSRFGLPEDPFGSAMVTSVGMLKVPSGFPPLVPMSRVPLIVCVGQTGLKPLVVNGEVVARPVLDLSVTFDHRFIDGLVGARMNERFVNIIQNPETHLS